MGLCIYISENEIIIGILDEYKFIEAKMLCL